MGDFAPSDRRNNLRGVILVMQVKMGEERKYFFGYAKNISRSGIFIQTITPKNPGDEFTIDFSIPKTDIIVKCRAQVIWSRKFTDSRSHEPGMGLHFLDLDPAVADKIEQWIIQQIDEDESRRAF